MDNLINKSKVKDYTGDMKVTFDYLDELNEELKRVIDKSIKRARDNNRTTLMSRDI